MAASSVLPQALFKAAALLPKYQKLKDDHQALQESLTKTSESAESNLTALDMAKKKATAAQKKVMMLQADLAAQESEKATLAQAIEQLNNENQALQKAATNTATNGANATSRRRLNRATFRSNSKAPIFSATEEQEGRTSASPAVEETPCTLIHQKAALRRKSTSASSIVKDSQGAMTARVTDSRRVNPKTADAARRALDAASPTHWLMHQKPLITRFELQQLSIVKEKKKTVLPKKTPLEIRSGDTTEVEEEEDEYVGRSSQTSRHSRSLYSSPYENLSDRKHEVMARWRQPHHAEAVSPLPPSKRCKTLR